MQYAPGLLGVKDVALLLGGRSNYLVVGGEDEDGIGLHVLELGEGVVPFRGLLLGRRRCLLGRLLLLRHGG